MMQLGQFYFCFLFFCLPRQTGTYEYKHDFTQEHLHHIVLGIRSADFSELTIFLSETVFNLYFNADFFYRNSQISRILMVYIGVGNRKAVPQVDLVVHYGGQKVYLLTVADSKPDEFSIQCISFRSKTSMIIECLRMWQFGSLPFAIYSPHLYKTEPPSQNPAWR